MAKTGKRISRGPVKKSKARTAQRISKRATAPTDAPVRDHIDQTLILTRMFDAPRELVWKALSEPSSIMKWWGPREFTSPSCTVDFRVDGKYLFCMRSPDGKDYWSTGVYREIVPLQRIMYSDSFSDENGNVVPPSHYGLPGDFPGEMRVVLELEEFEGKTRMTLQHVGMPAEMTKDASEGWNGSFDKLENSLREEQTASDPGTTSYPSV